jgi:hypothetical protein
MLAMTGMTCHMSGQPGPSDLDQEEATTSQRALLAILGQAELDDASLSLVAKGPPDKQELFSKGRKAADRMLEVTALHDLQPFLCVFCSGVVPA